MTVKELIEELRKLDPKADVWVWGGYNAGGMTIASEVYKDEDGDVVIE